MFSARFNLALFALIISAFPAMAQEKLDAHAMFQSRCAACHGGDRLGGIGPALLPENLGRLRKAEAVKVVTEGRPATQMEGFGHELDQAMIKELVDYVYSPLPQIPAWGIAEIEASREPVTPVSVEKPAYKADPLNLFVVVEGGDHHITILDGDSFESLIRIPTRYALHGGPKFTSDGRYVFWASRDGWVTKFDLWALAPVAEVRAGINTRNIAVSSDDRYVMVANYLPNTLVVLDAENLKPIKIIPVTDGIKGSRVSAVYNAPPRKSFIVALKDIPEVWEIPYSDDPPYYGWVHDWQNDGPPKQQPLPIRRIILDDYLDDFFFDQDYEHLLGAARDGGNAQVVWLRSGRKIADVALSGLPHLGSGITWNTGQQSVLASPNLQKSELALIDMKDWSVIKMLETPGPGFFLRSHKDSPYAWGDGMMGKNKDTMYLVDKQTMTIARTIRPEPGRTAAHVEFDRYGKYALISIWEMDGALLVYDTNTLEVVKRLPMSKPVGKYNVWNKITFSEGTSH